MYAVETISTLSIRRRHRRDLPYRRPLAHPPSLALPQQRRQPWHHRQLEQRDEEAAEQARKVLRMQRQMYDAAEEKLRAKADVAEKVVTEAAAAAAGGA